MSVAIVTGSAGLIGAEAVRLFTDKGMDVVGIDNDMRRYFFGNDASTVWSREHLQRRFKNYLHVDADIRDEAVMTRVFDHYGRHIEAIIHTAAQPSHDWAAREPITDFTVNANGTLNFLELTRRYCPEAVFIFTSTNKVYGDLVNHLPFIETETRWELNTDHPYSLHGIDEGMSIDQSLHSLFGASKVAADVLVQEYGKYFGMKTGCFRGGCLTGSGHAGTQLHGFLAYLVKCAITDTPYMVIGYKGKQVRDNIHAYDLVHAFWHFFQRPGIGEVYNIGGGRHAHCSILEAIDICEREVGRPLSWSYSDIARTGDHIWWISDIRKFQAHYPHWYLTYDVKGMIAEIHGGLSDRLLTEEVT